MRFLMCLICAVVLASGTAVAQQAGSGWIGADIKDLTKEEAEALGWEEPRGAKVVKAVPGSPAEAAGLQPDDVLVSLDGQEIDNVASFVKTLSGKPAGAEVRLSVRRAGRERRLGLTLGARPAQFAATKPREDRPQLMLDTGGHMALIRDITFTADGKQLVSASDDKTIRVWDLATGKTTRILRGESAPGDPGKIFAMALSPDGKWLAAAGYVGIFTGTKAREDEEAHKIRLFDFASGRLVALLKGHTDVVFGLAFSPDGRRLISGSADSTAILWDVETRKATHRLKQHRDFVFAVAFTPDGARVVTGSDDHDLRLWRVADGSEIAPMRGHGDKVRSLAIAPDGTIASGDWSGEIRLWDGKTGAFRKTLARQPTEVGSLSFSRDGSRLLSGISKTSADSNPYGAKVFDVASGREIVTYPGHDNVVIATAISPDERWAATGGGSNNEIHLWDPRSGPGTTPRIGERRLGADGQPLTLTGQGRPVWAVGFAADGRSIAWGNDVATARSLGRLWVAPADPRAALGGRRHAAPAQSRSSGNRWPPPRHAEARRMVAETPQGRQLCHRRLSRHRARRTYVASIERDTTSGLHHRSYTFTPDGQTIISGGGNGVLSAYDTQGRKLGDFIGHEADIWAVTPSPDGRFLLSGSADQTLRLWNLNTRELLLTLFHGQDGEWVMWTPQGYYVGSPKGADLVGWQINRGVDQAADYVAAAQLRRTLRRPDIVARTIALASAKAAVLEAPGADRSIEDILARNLPKLELLSPRIGATVQGGAATLAVSLSPTDDPVKLIRVSVNGIQLPDQQPKQGTGFAPGRVELGVPLAQGENAITLIAVNTEGYESEPLRVRLTHEGEGGLDQRGTLYLVSIGVDAYPAIPGNFCPGLDGKPKASCDLDFAGKDAAAFHEAMLKGLGPLHEKVEARLLVNAPGKTAPSAEAIRDVLGLLRRAKPNDTVAVFLSGHGYNDGRDYLLLPTDAEWSKDLRAFRRSKAVLWTEIQTAIQNAQGRRMLFMDTCHAGNSHAGGLDEAAYFANIIAYYSARWDQLAVEAVKYGHGAFTKAVIEGIDGRANADGDRQITTKELRDYLDRRVPELAAEFGQEQNPQFFQARDAQVYSLARVN